jgi:hypothetical protein
MKKSIFTLLVLVVTSISAQEEFYVGLHYFKVKSEYANEFIEAEKNYYSKIHKANIDSGNKIAWDMWRLSSDNMDNSETIFVFAHLQEINKPSRMGNPEKMFPEAELKMVRKQRRKMVMGSKFIQTVFKGGFVPSEASPPKVAILNFVNAKPGKWSELENTMVNEIVPRLKKNSYVKGWGMHKIVSPSNDESDYIMASFYNSMNDYYKRRTPTNKISKSGLDRIKKMSTMREGVRTEILQLVLSER